MVVMTRRTNCVLHAVVPQASAKTTRTRSQACGRDFVRQREITRYGIDLLQAFGEWRRLAIYSCSPSVRLANCWSPSRCPPARCRPLTRARSAAERTASGTEPEGRVSLAVAGVHGGLLVGRSSVKTGHGLLSVPVRFIHRRGRMMLRRLECENERSPYLTPCHRYLAGDR